MAFLMLLHEKMRLQRKVNTLTYKQLRAANKKERITKNIERLQKFYDKKSNNLQNQAKMMQSQANIFFQNMAGVGAQNQMFNPFCYQNGSAGMTTATAQIMSSWFTDVANNPDKYKYKDSEGNDKQLDSTKAQKLWEAYCSGQLQPEKDSDGNITDANKYVLPDGTPVERQELQMLQNAMNLANNQVQQRQFSAQQMSSQYQNNVSIWLQAQEAQLEAEQDAMLLPLKAEESEMDLERESYEMQLADAKARLDGIKQACSEGIKDSAPTFGLG